MRTIINATKKVPSWLVVAGRNQDPSKNEHATVVGLYAIQAADRGGGVGNKGEAKKETPNM